MAPVFTNSNVTTSSIEPPLFPFRVMLREVAGSENQTAFDCQAEDSDHAAEQAENAYPGVAIVSTVRMDAMTPIIEVSLDGGLTYVEAKEGVRIIYRQLPGLEVDTMGELHINATVEGLIQDFWTDPGTAQEHLSGTRAVMLGDILASLHNEDD